MNAVESSNWKHVADALQRSEKLLQATLNGNEEAIARGVEVAHDENTSILSYNDENSLACVLSIAYYYAKNDYVMHRELAIDQIHRKQYPAKLQEYAESLLLVGISYDRGTKQHSCRIERIP